ncbi:hypothetical protein BDV59DRAFT_188597 [Aspergillus ambiguus]|uniref:uncharacterized protein n=1 Tax=Aspergillus ambiguus TaxID=176160 RepID=UPI003CCDA1DB
MVAGGKRTLAERLETDELYSEAVRDDLYTENHTGVEISRKNSRIPLLETEIGQLKDDNKRLERQVSELHDAFIELGQKTDRLFEIGFVNIRNRFLSTYRRDFLGDKTKENQTIIERGNHAAHHGYFQADAKLYLTPGGFMGEDGNVYPPRTDRDTLQLLYGVGPSIAEKDRLHSYGSATRKIHHSQGIR